jgi:hypothetical protein
MMSPASGGGQVEPRRRTSMATNTQRVCIYEMKDGTEEVVKIEDKQHEQHERAAAEREARSSGTQVKGYRFEWKSEEK